MHKPLPAWENRENHLQPPFTPVDTAAGKSCSSHTVSLSTLAGSVGELGLHPLSRNKVTPSGVLVQKTPSSIPILQSQGMSSPSCPPQPPLRVDCCHLCDIHWGREKALLGFINLHLNHDIQEWARTCILNLIGWLADKVEVLSRNQNIIKYSLCPRYSPKLLTITRKKKILTQMRKEGLTDATTVM